MPKSGYIDTHTHPYKEYFDDPEAIVKKWYEEGIEKMFFVGTSLPENREVYALSKQFDFLYPLYGIHPHVAKGKQNAQELRTFLKSDASAIGVGEIGLDFHYASNPSKEVQIETFKAQIDIAQEFNLPVMVHSRDAFEETYKVLALEKYRNVKFSLHTFSGDTEWAKKFLDLGCYFSFSGVVTFKNAKKVQEACKIIPLDRIFSETDAPFLTPHPFRGKKNSSINVKLVVAKIAELKNVSVETMKQQIYQNVKEFFKV